MGIVFKFIGYEISSDALDGKASTHKMKAGKTYGHIVSTTQYFQLTPIDIDIDCALNDTKQCEFDKLGHAWQWQVHLDHQAGNFEDGIDIALLPVHVAAATKHDGDEGDGLAKRSGDELRDGIEQSLAGRGGLE